MNKTRRILLDFEADKLYAAKLSFQRGVDGYVSFVAKTKLVDHYISYVGRRSFWRAQNDHYQGSQLETY